jgi:alpha-galactosidase
MTFNLVVSYYLNNTLYTIDKELADGLVTDHFTVDYKAEALRSKSTFKHKVVLKLKEAIKVEKLQLVANINYDDKISVLINGFQSWTETREYYLNEKIDKLSPLIYNLASPAGDSTIFHNPHKKGYLHSFTHTYIRSKVDNRVLFLGSLNEDKKYTIFQHIVPENKLYINADCKGITIGRDYSAFELFECEDFADSAWQIYFAAMPPVEKKARPATGWTSWYYHYTDIDEKVINDNIAAFDKHKIPIDYFQIDDGWQEKTGDWLRVNKKFPSGLKALTDNIHAKGYKAGLWLAPFIASGNSELFEKHPDWLVQIDDHHLVHAGYNPGWGKGKNAWYYALDIYNDAVVKYLEDVFKTVFTDWGFDMVKLDFLFAAGLTPRRDKTRGEIMRDAMQLLRRICGDKIILGCGVPLGPSYGLVDYCRIGSDISLGWELKSGKAVGLRERISTKNALLDTINRRAMNGRVFLNDPDVFILRDKKNRLSKAQQYTLLVTNLLFGGLVFTSDNIDEYDEETMHLYKSTFPHVQKQTAFVNRKGMAFEIRIRIQSLYYRIFINLGKKETSFEVKDGAKFYSSENKKIEQPTTVKVKSYQTKVYLEQINTGFCVAGGGGHIFPGAEVEQVSGAQQTITIKLNPKVLNKEILWIRVPESDKTSYIIDGIEHQIENIDGIRMVKYKPV